EAASREVLRTDPARTRASAGDGEDGAAYEADPGDDARPGAAREGAGRVRGTEAARASGHGPPHPDSRWRQVEPPVPRPRLREEDRPGRERDLGPLDAARRSDRDHCYGTGRAHPRGDRGRTHRRGEATAR